MLDLYKFFMHTFHEMCGLIVILVEYLRLLDDEIVL